MKKKGRNFMSDQSSCPSPFGEPDFEAAISGMIPACYTAQTGDITVNVRSFWMEEQSQPDEHCYTWLYHITIENNGPHRLQLLSRCWTLIDANGQREEIHGIGVAGEQPVLGPSGSYDYTSAVELKTPNGFMFGQYHMLVLPPASANPQDRNAGAARKPGLQTAMPGDSRAVTVDIPAFSLDSPHHIVVLH